jgi:hypothetical protein
MNRTIIQILTLVVAYSASISAFVFKLRRKHSWNGVAKRLELNAFAAVDDEALCEFVHSSF